MLVAYSFTVAAMLMNVIACMLDLQISTRHQVGLPEPLYTTQSLTYDSGTGRTSNLNKLKGQMRPLHSRGLRKDGGAGLPRDSKRAINNIPRSYD